ncbi:MAG: hypothetical protein WC516_08425 [Patescibacteria group bacterium]|jgi:hypothetical protein
MNKNQIVKIYRGTSGWHYHYHKPDCIYAQSSDYKSFNLTEVLKMEAALGFKYKPCGCMLGLPTALLGIGARDKSGKFIKRGK